ncbi:DUF2285 domain-containing protein [Bradyrhizobium sp. CW7]|uniref:DNA -binding domain-containing protein n=1 Tax=Bradyrhizobium sp. CW7 TaxID=2782688 RepID=UPI002096F6AD|nr:DUF2285 domain-containing protein [Bradyrhizobium sp. CW7]
MACDRDARGSEASPLAEQASPGWVCVVLDLPLDANFELRVQAARRLWLALEHRPLGTPPLALPALKQRQQILALRALDGMAGRK